MKRVIRHLTEQPFIVATGFAALIHSTWALGTLFSGQQPSDALALILWLIPALLIAFSLDVGQIVTSAELRAGQRSKAKYLTFGVFAAATYFLQFVYCAAHIPSIALAAGVRSDWQSAIGFIRDSAVFVVPALLPLSTLLYTFSQEHPKPQIENVAPIESPALQVETAEPSNALALLAPDIAKRVEVEKPFEIECTQCAWAGNYPTQQAANMALTGHRRKHVAPALSSNGNH